MLHKIKHHARKYKRHIAVGSTIITIVIGIMFFFNSGCEMAATSGGVPTGGTGTISGTVKDADGYGMLGVSVSGGGKTTTTNINGEFSLTSVPAANGIIVNYSKTLYVPTQQKANLQSGGVAYLGAHLTLIGTSETIDPAIGGTVSDEGGSITINPNSLTGISGSDPVVVQFTSFDPTVTPEFNSFPGDFAGRTQEGAADTPFETFGYVNVTVMQGTTKLTLNGTAELHIPVPVSLQSDPDLPDPTIDLWSYNESLGKWILDGVATLEPGHTYYWAIITHFSWWNADQIYNTGYISGKVIDMSQNAVAGAYIRTIPVDWYGAAPSWNTISGADGTFSHLPVKAGGVTQIYAIKGIEVSTLETTSGGHPTVGEEWPLPYDLVLSISGPTVTNVTVKEHTNRIILGSTGGLYAQASNPIYGILSGKTFYWQSDDPGVASVDPTGSFVTVYGNSMGSCIVSATCEGVGDWASVTVVSPTVETIEITPSPAYVALLGSRALTGTAKNNTGDELPGKSFIWSSNNTAFATVEPVGASTTVYGKAPGTCIISATYEAVIGTALITVEGTPWTVVGTTNMSVGTGYWSSMYITNETIYVAYQDYWNSQKASVKSYDISTGPWSPVGSLDFSPGVTRYTSLHVYDDIPYVAYRDEYNGGMPTVMSFEAGSGTWIPVGFAGFYPNAVEFTSLDIYNGIPYVAFRDTANGNKATVMKYIPGGNTWEVVGSPNFSSGEVRYIPLVVNNGTPYVAYNDEGNGGRATAMSFEAGSAKWIPVGNFGFSSGSIWDEGISLYVYDNIPYVAFGDESNGTKATVMKYVPGSNTWALVGNAGFSGGMARYTSLFVHNGAPYVAYLDSSQPVNRCTVMSFEATSNTWQNVGIPGFSDGPAAWQSLFIYNGIPYVSFTDYAHVTGVTVMKNAP